MLSSVSETVLVRESRAERELRRSLRRVLGLAGGELLALLALLALHSLWKLRFRDFVFSAFSAFPACQVLGDKSLFTLCPGFVDVRLMTPLSLALSSSPVDARLSLWLLFEMFISAVFRDDNCLVGVVDDVL